LFTEKFENVKKFLLDFAQIKNENLKAFEVFKNFQKFSLDYENNFMIFSTFESFQKFFNFSKSVNVLKFYDEIKNYLEEKFLKNINIKEEFLSKPLYHDTLIHQIIDDDKSAEFIAKLFSLISKVLNEEEKIKLFLKAREFEKVTSLMFAAQKSKLKILKVFWSFINENFDDEEKRKILLKEDKNLGTALQYSMQNSNPNVFLFVKKIYEEKFSQQEIREILKQDLTVFWDVIKDASHETAFEVSKYFKNLFKNKKFELRKLLSQQYEKGLNSLGYGELKGKSNIFIELLRETFEENEEKEFKNYFDGLKFELRIFQNFSNSFENFYLDSESKCSEDDFLFLFENFEDLKEKLGEETLKKILQMKTWTWDYKTILHVLASSDETENFLEIIQKYLNKTEIINLIFAKNEVDGQSSLMLAAENKKFKSLKTFWNFCDEKLEEKEKKEILNQTDSFFQTALHFAAQNKDPKSFLFIKEIYETFFSREEIIKILIRSKPLSNYREPFIWNVIKYASPETVFVVSNFFENLFKDEKFELRKILNQRNKDGLTIFGLFKKEEEYSEKLKNLIKLLRKTFEENQEKEFKSYLKALQLKLNIFKDYFDNYQNFTVQKSDLGWSEDDFKFLINNFDELKNEVEIKNLKEILQTKNNENQTILHDLLKNELEAFVKPVLGKISNFLNENEIFSLVFAKNNKNKTSLSIVAQDTNFKILKVFWKFLHQNFNANKIKEILLFKDENLKNFLQLSSSNSDPSVFFFVLEIYETKLNEKEFKNVLGESLKDVIENIRLENVVGMAKYLENLFKNKKIELRKVLSHKDENGWTIYGHFKNKDFYERKFEIFVGLLRKTFNKNQEIEFEKYLKRVKLNLIIFKKITNDFENFYLESKLKCSEDDFEFLVESFDELKEKLDEESLRKILKIKTERDENFLNFLAFKSKNESFLEIIHKYLNRTEISYLIFTNNEDGQNSLMLAAENKNLNSLKVFWNFHDKNLEEKEKKEILMQIDKNFKTALHYSTQNQDLKSFLFVIEIYEKFLTQAEIRKVLSQLPNYGDSFIWKIMDYSSLETALEVSKYFENLFKNEKVELRKILSHQNGYGWSIFKKFKNDAKYSEKFKIFTDLLRKTFHENQEKEFKNDLNILKFELKIFENFKVDLESFYIDIDNLDFNDISEDDFSFLAENFEEITKKLDEESLRKFLQMKTMWDLSPLHVLASNNDNNENFLSGIHTFLNKTEIVDLIFAKTMIGQNSLMLAAENKNLNSLKVFWNFHDKNLDEKEKKEILMQPDLEHSWSVLQFAAKNQDPKSFLFIKNIYEKIFTQAETRKLLSRNEFRFIAKVIFNSSPETALEVSEYFEDLFENQYLELRKILSQRNDFGETIFHWFMNNEKFEEKSKILFKLLRKTFGENEEEEYEKTLERLQIYDKNFT
jgi:hypothetical protein